MKIGKTTLHILLICALLFSGLPSTAMAVTKNQKAIDIATGLGIVDAAADLEKTVTRGEFILYVARIMNFDFDALSKQDVFYKDVQPNHSASLYINALTQMKILSGNDERKFFPDEPIFYQDAVKILVSILGLDYLAYANGGYPAGYLSVADSKKINRGYSSSVQTITTADVATLLVATLEAPLSESNPIDGVLERGGSETYMSKRLKIKKTNGIVTANSLTDLEGARQNGQPTVTINNTIFYSQSNQDDLLGRFVHAYYQYDEAASRNVLLYAYVPEEKNTVLTIKADNLHDFYDNIYYYENDEFDSHERKAKLPVDYTLIYNKMALSDGTLFDISLMQPQVGYVTLLDNDGDSEYDIVFVQSYRTVVVSGYDRVNDILYDELSDYPIEPDSYAMGYEIYNADGTKSSLSSIAHEMAVLSVAESLEKDYMQIIHSPKVIQGVVEETDHNNEYCTIGGGKYAISPNATLMPEVSDEGDFYLDHEDKIVYFKRANSTGELMGYLISIGQKSKLSDDITMKIYSEKNTILLLDGSTKMKINGYDCKTLSEKSQQLKLGDDYKQLIRYRLNEEGKVKWVDTVAVGSSSSNPAVLDTDDSLSQFTIPSYIKTAALRYYSYSKSLEGIIGVRADTKVFVIPEPFNEEQIYVTSPSGFYTISGKSSSVATAAYRTKPDSRIADVIVEKAVYMKDATKINFDSANSMMASIVEDVTKVIDVNQEVGYRLKLNYNGTVTSILTSSLEAIKIADSDGYVHTISKGDVVRYGLNKYGKIDKGNIILLYDEEVHWLIKSAPYYVANAHTGDHRLLRGFMYDKEEAWIRVTDYLHPAELGFDADSKTFLYPTSAIPNIMVYNRATQRLRKGNMGDFKYYKNVGNGCSEFVFYSHYVGTNSMLVIYE